MNKNKQNISGSVDTSYLWKNLKIEGNSSKNWIYRLYKSSFLSTVWDVVSAPTN